jgi:nucleoside-diphosphate-sugar epimerase
MNNYFENKNVLITGGLGFLGSNLALALESRNANVTVIDNLEPLYGGNVYNLPISKGLINVVINDMRNMEVMQPLIQTADIIYHLGAQVSYIDSLNFPFEDLDLNAKSTLNILECCRKFNPTCRILFSSSRMVYGKVESEIVTEFSPTNPLSLYGIHKLTSETYLLMYYKDFGIPTTILRIANPYGPRQQIKHSKYSLIGWFIRQAMEDKEIKIFGEGNQLRDYIFVEDIIQAMIKCGEVDDAIGEILNVGSGKSYKFSEMVNEVVSCVNKGRVTYVPWPKDYEKIETGDVSLDLTKLNKITGWKPEYTLKNGIQKTFDYYTLNFNNYI